MYLFVKYRNLKSYIVWKISVLKWQTIKNIFKDINWFLKNLIIYIGVCVSLTNKTFWLFTLVGIFN